MKISVVGATGLVGSRMMALLELLPLPEITLIPVASEKSAGRIVEFRGQKIEVQTIQKAIALAPKVALFSAGGSVSKEFAPQFARQGTLVIDNSSAWRREAGVPLVVPEINGNTLKPGVSIIANPNCSTIQLVMTLAPIHANAGIKRVTVSTYQSVSGSGQKGIQQLMAEKSGKKGNGIYPWPIDGNVIPQGGSFMANGFTEEEMKLVYETCKILQAPEIEVAATVVRVPVTGGHSISASVECTVPCSASDVRRWLKKMPGVTIMDDPAKETYPMPLFCEGKDDVFVGRIRNDLFQPKVVHLWIVADNVRKGAATNAVQILQYLINHQLIALK
ncbi:MAG: aspartate-semialdehyde dehydrogenase [Bacteroidales bacterium]|nr:aspartate-semialdehyde dehydrogenase [Bacteroidales bacterium]MDD2322398.1 aspartate-semialdehyde dehydrogenase [Bacteroidales bacterium]MDD3960792.1 aspartate-semialdehyde dehydrogenase [Bacteroidales bacterium]MDY0285231.1 aspartate-semialdehyde dehydrogenase [Bacteroidales bacterium]HPE87248.1 aspartate-semialdehyde dehydrogenase [Bacteroidales bacterium]